jgi:virulence factor Mce-like protein
MRRLATIGAAFIAAIVAIAVASSSSQGSGKTYDVRAIFDDAAFAVPGEDVRIAGAPVGSIQSLDVTADKKAAVTLAINSADFTPFYANAHCAIRPQSLIGEKYVDCTPGTSSQPPLHKIASGPGEGTYYLPITRTSSPIDTDIVQDISQESIRQRFALILDELGTGLAARGSDLNAVIRRANPALGQTDKVVKILAHENKLLAQLATDSNTVLAPLARAKHELSDFVVQANTTSVASAARAADISRSFQLLPEFLRQLRPLLADLGQLADQGTPLMHELGTSASDLAREFQTLAPFARAARPALIELGNSSAQSQPALVATEPLARQLLNLGNHAEPTAKLLDTLTSSLNNTGAIEYLMSLLYYGVGATNTFDRLGHFARAEPQIGECSSYVKRPVLGCSANFFGPQFAADTARAAPTADLAKAPRAARAKVAHLAKSAVAKIKPHHKRDLKGLLGYLIGNKQ